MCLITACPAGTEKDYDYIKGCIEAGLWANSDGTGLAIRKAGQRHVIFDKTVDNIKWTTWKRVEALADWIKSKDVGREDDLLIHHRLTTHGANNEANRHPYKLSPHMEGILTTKGYDHLGVMAHNGIFPTADLTIQDPKYNVTSDSARFVMGDVMKSTKNVSNMDLLVQDVKRFRNLHPNKDLRYDREEFELDSDFAYNTYELIHGQRLAFLLASYGFVFFGTFQEDPLGYLHSNMGFRGIGSSTHYDKMVKRIQAEQGTDLDNESFDDYEKELLEEQGYPVDLLKCDCCERYLSANHDWEYYTSDIGLGRQRMCKVCTAQALDYTKGSEDEARLESMKNSAKRDLFSGEFKDNEYMGGGCCMVPTHEESLTNGYNSRPTKTTGQWKPKITEQVVSSDLGDKGMLDHSTVIDIDYEKGKEEYEKREKEADRLKAERLKAQTNAQKRFRYEQSDQEHNTPPFETDSKTESSSSTDNRLRWHAFLMYLITLDTRTFLPHCSLTIHPGMAGQVVKDQGGSSYFLASNEEIEDLRFVLKDTDMEAGAGRLPEYFGIREVRWGSTLVHLRRISRKQFLGKYLLEPRLTSYSALLGLVNLIDTVGLKHSKTVRFIHHKFADLVKRPHGYTSLRQAGDKEFPNKSLILYHELCYGANRATLNPLVFIVNNWKSQKSETV